MYLPQFAYYAPEPQYQYEPEYLTPVDWSWLDLMYRQATEDRERQRAALMPPLRMLPSVTGIPVSPPSQRAALRLVGPPAKPVISPRAYLAYFGRGIGETCKLPEVGSRDLLPLIKQLQIAYNELKNAGK